MGRKPIESAFATPKLGWPGWKDECRYLLAFLEKKPVKTWDDIFRWGKKQEIKVSEWRMRNRIAWLEFRKYIYARRLNSEIYWFRRSIPLEPEEKGEMKCEPGKIIMSGFRIERR